MTTGSSAEQSAAKGAARTKAALAAAALVAYGSWVGGKPGSGGAYEDLKSWLRGRTEREPLDSALSTVVVGGVLFYLAERGKNPKVNSVYDGMLYIATSLSVGYAESHPQTDAGKALASLVQTVGPNIAARALDAPAAATSDAAAENLEVQKRILERLDAIHLELSKR